MESNNKPINYYSIKDDEVTKLLQSKLTTGLSDEEVDLRLKKYGGNKITEAKSDALY